MFRKEIVCQKQIIFHKILNKKYVGTENPWINDKVWVIPETTEYYI